MQMVIDPHFQLSQLKLITWLEMKALNCELGIIHLLRNDCQGGRFLDLLYYFFIHMESYSTEYYERRGEGGLINGKYGVT